MQYKVNCGTKSFECEGLATAIRIARFASIENQETSYLFYSAVYVAEYINGQRADEDDNQTEKVG